MLLLVLIISVFIVPAVLRVSASGTNCVQQPSPSATYTVTPCITGPADGATVSGAVTVSADNGSPIGANPGIAKYIFYLTPINQPTPQYLLTDYGTPSHPALD